MAECKREKDNEHLNQARVYTVVRILFHGYNFDLLKLMLIKLCCLTESLPMPPAVEKTREVTDQFLTCLTLSPYSLFFASS